MMEIVGVTSVIVLIGTSSHLDCPLRGGLHSGFPERGPPFGVKPFGERIKGPYPPVVG